MRVRHEPCTVCSEPTMLYPKCCKKGQPETARQPRHVCAGGSLNCLTLHWGGESDKQQNHQHKCHSSPLLLRSWPGILPLHTFSDWNAQPHALRPGLLLPASLFFHTILCSGWHPLLDLFSFSLLHFLIRCIATHTLLCSCQLLNYPAVQP